MQIFIVLELITGGELFDKIVSEGKFNEETARFYFRQLVTGVKYCHNQGVCHRDLKPGVFACVRVCVCVCVYVSLSPPRPPVLLRREPFVGRARELEDF